jgi:hypothetical protein
MSESRGPFLTDGYSPDGVVVIGSLLNSYRNEISRWEQIAACKDDEIERLQAVIHTLRSRSEAVAHGQERVIRMFEAFTESYAPVRASLLLEMAATVRKQLKEA